VTDLVRAGMMANATYLRALLKTLVESGALDGVALTANLAQSRRVMEEGSEEQRLFDALVELTSA
jgi:hypothetical protein